MRWKYRVVELGAGTIFLLWFVFFARPDRIFLKEIIEYMEPAVAYAMDCVEYGPQRNYWAGTVMEAASGQMPIYGYSISYYGEGMVSEHYKEYVEVLLAESREESFFEADLKNETDLGNQMDLGKETEGAGMEESQNMQENSESQEQGMEESRNELQGQEENSDADSSIYDDSKESDWKKGDSKTEYPEYESDRLNEDGSVFYVTDGNLEAADYQYPEGLLYTPAKQEVSPETYATYEEMTKNYYTIDTATYIDESELNGEKFLKEDLSIRKSDTGPQILIYHTHSTEAYIDSVPGDPSTSIVGVGEVLAQILEKEYGYQVLHHTGQYDVESRDYAYSNALPALEQLLKDNPGIQVVIDLHRDAISDDTKLVTEIDGVKMARFMFFNGLSRVNDVGEIAYLPNPYLQDNLAFSFQMQISSETYYPGLARKIYLKGYRYNMHLEPRSLLIELGAQNNTVQEAVNACVPIARILNEVLSGK